MSKVTWAEIDKLQTADEIATLLHSHGVKGIPCHRCRCPLAVATGWEVGTIHRHIWLDSKYESQPLTEAEKEFVKLFDFDALYPYLDEDADESIDKA